MHIKLKPDWLTWLHAYKTSETRAIFSNSPKKMFRVGLELGAGSGFQSTLLSEYIEHLTSTEINPHVLKSSSSPAITFKICDAFSALSEVGIGEFDVIFSSNLLEHVTNPGEILAASYRALSDGGIAIHVMPSRFWKACQILFYIPANIVVTIERMIQAHGIKNKLIELRMIVREALQGLMTGTNQNLERNYQQEILTGNNSHITKVKPKYLKSLILPMPHGIALTHREEFTLFSRKHWMDLFATAGFTPIRIRKGPVASGYGLGWKSIAMVLEKVGFVSEYIYVIRKKGQKSDYEKYFR